MGLSGEGEGEGEGEAEGEAEAEGEGSCPAAAARTSEARDEAACGLAVRARPELGQGPASPQLVHVEQLLPAAERAEGVAAREVEARAERGRERLGLGLEVELGLG